MKKLINPHPGVRYGKNKREAVVYYDSANLDKQRLNSTVS